MHRPHDQQQLTQFTLEEAQGRGRRSEKDLPSHLASASRNPLGDFCPNVGCRVSRHQQELARARGTPDALFSFPQDIRRVIYTTNAIESLNSTLRKIIKTRRVFPSEEAATKLLYLALQNIAKKWTKPIKEWRKALNQFAILFEDRVPTR